MVLLVPLPGEDARPGDVDRGVVGTVRRAVIAGKGAHLGLQEMNNVKDKIKTCSNSERIFLKLAQNPKRNSSFLLKVLHSA